MRIEQNGGEFRLPDDFRGPIFITNTSPTEVLTITNFDPNGTYEADTREWMRREREYERNRRKWSGFIRRKKRNNIIFTGKRRNSQ